MLFEQYEEGLFGGDEDEVLDDEDLDDDDEDLDDEDLDPGFFGPGEEDEDSEHFLALDRARTWAHAAPPADATVRAAPKPGRNDPCWCGSGKKYKKCHG